MLRHFWFSSLLFAETVGFHWHGRSPFFCQFLLEVDAALVVVVVVRFAECCVCRNRNRIFFPVCVSLSVDGADWWSRRPNYLTTIYVLFGASRSAQTIICRIHSFARGTLSLSHSLTGKQIKVLTTRTELKANTHRRLKKKAESCARSSCEDSNHWWEPTAGGCSVHGGSIRTVCNDLRHRFRFSLCCLSLVLMFF